MIIAIGYGMASGGFVEGLKTVAGDPWGRVTLADLASGLLVAGAWIGWREASIARAAPWWIALILTGNLALGVYLIRAARSSTSMGELLLGTRARP
jgi:F0F1-type ATP synthase assembly protein I